ncbi:KAP family P-loop NTPase fold protein [Alteromonas sp. a30]|uniref:KAP family P-loop NTPase fold protein n=1 Tax=Alteromonas sp. a30 TaxID=2730917 RepID=UPI002282732B|nr:P-loop NTPase fold protein [Alteromonas sp. a30]MCY7296273.1 NTPase [Alteromonas sp. a30]
MPQDHYKTLNDAPYLNDDFYCHFVNELAHEIGASKPPKTLAITGYWGSGKTSALAQLFRRLTGKLPESISNGWNNHSGAESSIDSLHTTEQAPPLENYIGVWFEAWRYQHEEQPIVALLHAIKEEFSWLQKLKTSGKKMLDLTVLGSLSIFDSAIKVATKTSGDLKNMPKLAEKYEKDNLLATLPTDKIHLALKEAIDALLSSQKSDATNNKPADKLLIFIDDLDRCQPQAALKLLEGLKLYLSIPNCVIVMAIDQAQLEHAISSEFGESPQKYFMGVEYLEKLCQDAHRLPLMTQEKGAALIKTELTRLLSITDGDETNIPLLSLLNDMEDIIHSSRCLPANPRRIKMIVNRLARHIRYELRQSNNEQADVNDSQWQLKIRGMLLLACLYVSYRQIYEQLEWDIDFYDDLHKFSLPDSTFSEDELKHSPLEGLRQPDVNTHHIGEPPSDLSVLRPMKIIQSMDDIEAKIQKELENRRLENKTPISNSVIAERLRKQQNDDFKAVLKQLIHAYNG